MITEARSNMQEVQNTAPAAGMANEQEDLTATVVVETRDVEEAAFDELEEAEDMLTDEEDEYVDEDCEDDEEDEESDTDEVDEYEEDDDEERYYYRLGGKGYHDYMSFLKAWSRYPCEAAEIGSEYYSDFSEYAYRCCEEEAEEVREYFEHLEWEFRNYWKGFKKQEKTYLFDYDGCPVTVDVDVTSSIEGGCSGYDRDWWASVPRISVDAYAKFSLHAHMPDFFGDIRSMAGVDWEGFLPYLLQDLPDSIRLVNEAGAFLDGMEGELKLDYCEARVLGKDLPEECFVVSEPDYEMTDEKQKDIEKNMYRNAERLAQAVARMRVEVHALLKENLDVLQAMTSELRRFESTCRVEILYGLPVVGPKIERLLSEAVARHRDALVQKHLQPIRGAMEEMYQGIVELFRGRVEGKGKERVIFAGRF
ncbi:MAG: hypothetical protein RMJ43_00305 [Chloroherpetonaceae bacterium]|nr:hypothetical protein [Chthonomonadaceae bacterium]MDW8206250.1 hypothetical protein [Chloroherpetonaceae bacterium]